MHIKFLKSCSKNESTLFCAQLFTQAILCGQNKTFALNKTITRGKTINKKSREIGYLYLLVYLANYVEFCGKWLFMQV